MASFKDAVIPYLSSSSAGTQPRLVVASARISSFKASRFLAVSFLESLRSENQVRSS